MGQRLRLKRTSGSPWYVSGAPHHLEVVDRSRLPRPWAGTSSRMWGLTTVVGAFALALVVMSFAFMGGAVVVAVPVALVAVGIAAFMDFKRRRTTAQSIHAHRPDSDRDVEFTDRDQRTLVSE